ncbi:hypothetical protein AGMMS50284_3120 [Clostridia bacterium]|nr:hypothetical protein AGMMS50284_3120 [Clostridia bacterium]
MNHFRKVVAIVLAAFMLITVGLITTGAVNLNDEQTVAADSGTQIIVHYKAQTSTVPQIYYWNSLPQNIETTYPGTAMALDLSEGDSWYTYTFSNVTKINLLFIENGSQSQELTRGAAGEYWYKNNRWYTKNPEKIEDVSRTDLREDTIYFVITTRFYDGNTGNNVHCWDDAQAGNPDSDPAWRGDFKGLIDKLDYIKALGFSAIWITPVVTNGSGYDYHGYHAFDFSTVDVRYESAGATYQDLIDAAHAKDMKIVQDIVMQHTGNFGEATFAHLFDKKYDTIQDLADLKTSMVPNENLLSAFNLSSPAAYYAQLPAVQYQQRLNVMKQLSSPTQNSTSGNPIADIGKADKVSTDPNFNTKNYYHNGYWQSLNWDDYTAKYAQIAGDCVDLNTENPEVMEKLVNIYGDYINMGVDGFRVDTVRHVPRLSLNVGFNKQINAIGGSNFYMFGEICCRYSQVWYRGHASESVQFYTWDEPDTSYTSRWKTTNTPANVNANMDLTLEHWAEYDDTDNQPTSTNAFLNGNDYHTPDYSKASGMGAIDFTMHWNFNSASGAFNTAKAGDKYYNDSTWNVTYVESHDYSPDNGQSKRFAGGTATWAENLSLMFTFRGIPCLYYGGEVEFQADKLIDVGPNAPLSTTGRAYFGDYLEGSVNATDFSQYTASGTVATTLSSPLAKHVTRLNQIRRAVPALQKGQYSVTGVTGDLSYKRGYTDPTTGSKSFACVAVTNGATFTGVPNGTYTEAVTGATQTVTNGTLTVAASGKGNARVYVLGTNGYTGISGKIGVDGAYLK